MEMKQVKIQDIQGKALDYLVAKCEGATDEWSRDKPFFWNGYTCIREGAHDVSFKPSTNWDHGGPIIERENIGVWWDGEWHAKYNGCFDVQDARQPLVTAMRCYVASKLGDVVEIPASLL